MLVLLLVAAAAAVDGDDDDAGAVVVVVGLGRIANPWQRPYCEEKIQSAHKHKSSMNKISSFSSTIAHPLTCQMLIRKISQEDLVFKQSTKMNATKKKKCEHGGSPQR
jgi:hypothetical protein